MRNDVVEALSLIQAIDGFVDVNQLTAEVMRVVTPFGVTSVSTNLIITPGRVLRPGILFGSRWREWSNRYAREGFGEADPAVKMLRDQTRPFSWREAEDRYRSRASARVMDACGETTGCREGVVVPVRESDGALLSAAFCGPALDPDPSVRSALHLAGYYYATRGREILHGVELVVDCPLTPRQLECLKWVLAGKTDNEIAVVLGLSTNTVHNHIEAAKDRLGVSKRGQAAFTAWRRGWLD